MQEILYEHENVIRILRGLIRGVIGGLDPVETGNRFRDILRGAKPDDFSIAAQSLVNEGLPSRDVEKIKDNLINIFKQEVKTLDAIAPVGHPIYILMTEHGLVLETVNKFQLVTLELAESGNSKVDSDTLNEINSLFALLKETANHYIREENVLFPYIEKHGLTGPPKAMWMEHDEIRELENILYRAGEKAKDGTASDFSKSLGEAIKKLSDLLQVHFKKENTILFPAAMRLLDEIEWIAVRKQFDQIGYPSFLPKSATKPMAGQDMIETDMSPEGGIIFDTGNLNANQIEAMFRTLPVEITFIDEHDKVCFFNESKNPIFTRTKAIIGRQVQLCHPVKSVDLVNQILKEFRSGHRDVAEFQLNLGGKYVYIRYFAVRDKNKNYLGAMEVTQDLTEIQKLKGEKRLL